MKVSILLVLSLSSMALATNDFFICEYFYGWANTYGGDNCKGDWTGTCSSLASSLEGIVDVFTGNANWQQLLDDSWSSVENFLMGLWECGYLQKLWQFITNCISIVKEYPSRWVPFWNQIQAIFQSLFSWDWYQVGENVAKLQMLFTNLP